MKEKSRGRTYHAHMIFEDGMDIWIATIQGPEAARGEPGETAS